MSESHRRRRRSLAQALRSQVPVTNKYNLCMHVMHVCIDESLRARPSNLRILLFDLEAEKL